MGYWIEFLRNEFRDASTVDYRNIPKYERAQWARPDAAPGLGRLSTTVTWTSKATFRADIGTHLGDGPTDYHGHACWWDHIGYIDLPTNVFIYHGVVFDFNALAPLLDFWDWPDDEPGHWYLDFRIGPVSDPGKLGTTEEIRIGDSYATNVKAAPWPVGTVPAARYVISDAGDPAAFSYWQGADEDSTARYVNYAIYDGALYSVYGDHAPYYIQAGNLVDKAKDLYPPRNPAPDALKYGHPEHTMCYSRVVVNRNFSQSFAPNYITYGFGRPWASWIQFQPIRRFIHGHKINKVTDANDAQAHRILFTYVQSGFPICTTWDGNCRLSVGLYIACHDQDFHFLGKPDGMQLDINIVVLFTPLPDAVIPIEE